MLVTMGLGSPSQCGYDLNAKQIIYLLVYFVNIVSQHYDYTVYSMLHPLNSFSPIFVTSWIDISIEILLKNQYQAAWLSTFISIIIIAVTT